MCVYISHVLSSKRLFLSRIHEATWKVPQFIKHHKLWPRYFWTLYGWYPKNLDSINVALCMGTEPSINDLNSPWFTFAPPRRWQPNLQENYAKLQEWSTGFWRKLSLRLLEIWQFCWSVVKTSRRELRFQLWTMAMSETFWVFQI
jgi:hypothetical protein